MLLTRPSQPRSRFWFALVAALACLCVPCSAQQQEDVGSVYLNAYMLADDAKKLEEQGQFAAALRKNNDAANILDTIARTNPGWRREVVTYRRRKVNEAIARCGVHVPGPGVPKGYSNPQRETYIPPPSVGGSSSKSLLDQKDSAIRDLQFQTERLLGNLKNTQSELERTKRDLNTSRTAQQTLTFDLAETRRQLANANSDPEAMRQLEAKIKGLSNELAIANESLAAADKRNEKLQSELQQANDIIVSLKTEREELQSEREQLDDLLKGAKDSDIKRLLVENRSLKKELNAAREEAKKLTGEKELDAEKIAGLQERLAKVEGRLAELQQENTAYQERIAALSNKLRDTESNLKQALSGPGGKARMAKAALDENDALRGIVQRQIAKQSWRKEAKELVIEQIAKTGNLSRDLLGQIEKLADTGSVVTKEEYAMFKDSLLGELGAHDGVIIDNSPPQYPELLGHNDGTRNAVGLNENLTEFARALAADFARGNYAICESGYGQILDIAPNNIYAMRNLGIVELRLGKPEDAERLFQKAISTDSRDGYSHFLLGVCYYQSGLDDIALRAMQRGLLIDPNNAKAHHYAGAICIRRSEMAPPDQRQGLRDQARKQFESVVEIDPNFGDAYYNLAYLYVTDEPQRLALAREAYLQAQKHGTPPDAAMDRALGT